MKINLALRPHPAPLVTDYNGQLYKKDPDTGINYPQK